MKVAVAFEKPVYKDQTVAVNVGKIIAPTDTVTVAIRNAAGVETPLDLIASDVLYGGTTIQFDSPPASTPATIRAEDIVRVHAKHQFKCPVVGNYTAVLTELNPTTVLAGISTITLNGISRAVGVYETGTAANGITDAFLYALQSKLNTLLNGHGYANVTRGAQAPGSQTLTIQVTGSEFKPTTIGVAGFTITTAFPA